MNDMAHLDSLTSGDLHEEPIFLVRGPTAIPKSPEIVRQQQFRNLMRAAAPSVMVFANANAGKRNPLLARKEGIRGGVFDMTVAWSERCIAFVEMKGFDKRGHAGELQQNQIDWGNSMHRLGFPVACFFDPVEAIDWLREVGCPIRNMR
ncbi:hypothetical protein SLG_21920 [Sphingobium sp. SYK-6]|uniref:hypothetical protein n=1 Tax=Sphingobium sp. (strain NBRC 103272 / SYK-6) TaxID=627192 RepID=UPI00022770BB|nr:hypothetical protein [Sphingobium sp. SYK-6]BAK66867.1 hypothetical protein SLG_21920 [Sphingobium sp. SYK-6]